MLVCRGALACAVFAAAASGTSRAAAGDGEGLADVHGPRAPEQQGPAPQGEAAGEAAKDDKPKPAWDHGVFGYLRAGYDATTKDSRYEFIGRNNGFVLDSARVGLEGQNHDYDVLFRISIEGAAGAPISPNTPIGSLSVRLRDAFARWDPVPWAGVQVGQFKAPFQAEELRGTHTLAFASRAVGIDGVLTGRGLEQPGIQLDRQLGVMVSPKAPIGNEAFAASYYLMVMNGNGANQLLDDNGRLGIVGRAEANIAGHVEIGAAVFRNDRTVGTPPNLYNEEDLGLTGDVLARIAGLELFGAVTRVRTAYPTVGVSERVELAFHVQASYQVKVRQLLVAPGYRYAYFHPWQSGGGEGYDAFKLQYHTVGARFGHASLPVSAWLNYTFTQEESGRKLDNDRLEILGQLTF